MASPFRVFRKHQKAMLAVVGLMAMIAFVFLPVVMDQMQTRSHADPVVVTTEAYGDLNRSEISMMIGRRQALLGVLFQVQQIVQQAGGQGTEAMRLSRQIGEATEEGVVNTWLLAQKAKELGMAIDDSAINSVLNSLTEQRVAADRIRQLLRDSRMSQATLFESLQKELLALRLQEMFGISLVGTTPAQTWDYFRRLNRKATVEVAVLPVSRFTDRVSTPDDATLRKFFGRYKDDLPDPTTPEPGFRSPRRIAVEYVIADYEKVLETVEVSDEDIRTYYEEHKENYKREELPSLEPKTDGAAADNATQQPVQPAEKPATEKPATEKPATEKPVTEKPVTEKPVTEKPVTASESQSGPSASAGVEKPADRANTEKENADQSESAPQLAPPSNEGASAAAISPFSLASYRADDSDQSEDTPSKTAKETKAVEESKSAEAASDRSVEVARESSAKAPEQMEESTISEPAKKTTTIEITPVDSKESPAKPKAEGVAKQPTAAEAMPKEETAAETQEATPQPKEAAPTPPAVKTGEKPAAAEAEEKKTAETAAEKSKITSYIPLEEVREEIRRQLQRERAQAKVQDLIQPIQERMAVYYNQWIVYGASVEEQGQTTRTPPDRPELAKLVEGTPLTAHQTGLIAAFEAAQMDIGQSWTSSDPFLNFAFAPNFPKFKPATSQDNDGSSYLFWKTDDAEEAEADFDRPGVREEVLQQWKLVQARDLAEKEAKRLAEEATKSGQSMKEFFAAQKDIPVTEAGPFSWLTYGNIPPMYWLQSQQPPKISEVQGVDMAGSAFMETVFALNQGEIGVAMNRPQTEVYVVRAVEFNPLPDVLWTLFLEDRLSRFMAISADRRGLWTGWLEEIRQSVRFEWKEKPRRSAQDES